MANKNKKANDAILMALLQDLDQYLNGNPAGNATSTAAIAMANIERDGADQGDVREIATNEVLDQHGDIYDKINYQFQQHPEIADALDEFADANGLMQTDSGNQLAELAQLIALYLKRERKYAEGGQFENPGEFVDVTINGDVYHLLHLISEEQKEIGLKNVIGLDLHEGALFDYSDNPQAELSFWMKDTEISLLICFVNEVGKVISVHKGEPMSEEMITESSEFVAYVIEVGINENIKPGDQTSLGQQPIESEGENDNEEYPELEVNKLYIIGPDGSPQATLLGGERIFSIPSTKRIITLARRSFSSKEDKDYMALGKYVFEEMKAQNNREPEYVDN